MTDAHTHDAPTVTIRRATEADIPVIIDMQREAWEVDYRHLVPAGFLDVGLKSWTDPERIRETIAQYRLYDVAVMDDRVVGVVNGSIQDNGTFEIYWIHVSGAARRLGIGRRLVAHVIEAMSADVSAISVVTFQDYEPTIAFYTGVGFVEEKRYITQSHGFAIRDLRLRLELDQQP